jgi:diguanylate cyclase (GGDEF)-like protein
VDFAFRFGGDEFAMMIHADFSTACEKSRQVILKMDGKVSIGIATIDKDTPGNLSLEDFINRADSALYDAKRRGRGRAVVSQCNRTDTQECGSICTEKESCV